MAQRNGVLAKTGHEKHRSLLIQGQPPLKEPSGAAGTTLSKLQALLTKMSLRASTPQPLR